MEAFKQKLENILNRVHLDNDIRKDISSLLNSSDPLPILETKINLLMESQNKRNILKGKETIKATPKNLPFVGNLRSKLGTGNIRGNYVSQKPHLPVSEPISRPIIKSQMGSDLRGKKLANFPVHQPNIIDLAKADIDNQVRKNYEIKII